jgi:hypothetical protein
MGSLPLARPDRCTAEAWQWADTPQPTLIYFAAAAPVFFGTIARNSNGSSERFSPEKVAQVDEFVSRAGSIRKLLSETLDFPKLVERGRALLSTKAGPPLSLNRRKTAPR